MQTITPSRMLVQPALLLAFILVIVLVAAAMVLGAPRNDIEFLALLLGGSGVVSLVAGVGLNTAARSVAVGIRWKLISASLFSVVVALVIIVLTASLMFISQHDFSLLLLVIVFSATLSGIFIWLLAGEQARILKYLAAGANRIADGDLSVRLHTATHDELGGLAQSLNTLAIKLDQAAARQRDLMQARQTMMVAIAHDLRTPITSIRAMTEAVLDGVVSGQDDIHRYLQAIQSESQNLNVLISDLFELSQIDAGVLQLQKATVMPDELGEDALGTFAAEAARRTITLEGAFDPALPAIELDRARMQRVLNNLIENALRHTSAGGTIEMEIVPDPAGGIRLTVSDSGEGVQPADAPHLFERFYRGEPSRNRSTGGAGLGLAIARELVEAHGGQIWYEPNQPHGSRFCIRLPQK